MKRAPDTSPARLAEPERAAAPEESVPDSGGSAGAAAPADTWVPARADGVTLIGEFEQSGFEQPPSLVRRKDGQVVQLTELLYLTLEAVDGRRDLGGIAEEVSRRLGRTATADNVRFLLEEKLRPLGLLKNPDGSEPQVGKANPLLALRWRVVLSGERLTNRLTAPFAQLFRSPLVVLVVAGFVAVCGWVLFVRGMAQGARQALYSPALLVMVFVLTVLSAGFHEFGHAAACRFSGARPGVMGAGIYLVWPAFYTDVTDAYRLDRRGRLRTDLGGLYFNALFLLVAFGAWAVTGAEVFLLFVPLQLFQMLQQLLPVVRMDGYYILADLTGVPDLFSRIKPTLKSAVPGTGTEESAAVLKRWVRVTVTAWVVVVLPLLFGSALLAVISLPRVAATAWDSLSRRWDALAQLVGDGEWLRVASASIAIVALVLPLAGSVYSLLRIGRRGARRVWRATSERPAWRAVAAAGVVAAVAGLAWLWWPNGEYEPIGRHEKGTLVDGISAAGRIGSGRPALTDEKVETDALPVEADVTIDPADPVPGDDETDQDEAPAPTTTLADEPAPTTTLRRTTRTTVPTATTAVSAPEPDEEGEAAP